MDVGIKKVVGDIKSEKEILSVSVLLSILSLKWKKSMKTDWFFKKILFNYIVSNYIESKKHLAIFAFLAIWNNSAVFRSAHFVQDT